MRVTVGDSTRTPLCNGVSGYLSHSLYPLYVGLGDADHVDRIEVDWPSGGRQTIEGPIQANQLLPITEE